MSLEKRKNFKEGVVVSNKMEKTVVVKVERSIPHPRYQKVVRRSKRYYAHCEKKEVEVGKRVRIEETRPLSKLKRWRVIDILS